MGCGETKLVGYQNVDFDKAVKPDKVVDLNKFPWPWKTNSIDEILMEHVLEHLDNPSKVITEIHRILKPTGKANIKVPHYSTGANYFTHRTFWSVESFNTPAASQLKDGKWIPLLRMTKRKLKWLRYGPLQRKTYWWTLPFSWLIDLLINATPTVTERFFVYWIGGIEEIEFELTPNK